MPLYSPDAVEAHALAASAEQLAAEFSQRDRHALPVHALRRPPGCGHGNSATGANSVGGGIFLGSNRLTLRDSSVDNDSSQRAAGGIYDENAVQVALISSRVVHNHPTNCSGSPTPVFGCVD
jgi:hypothetical protein